MFACRINSINKKTHEIKFLKDCYTEDNLEYDIITFENNIKYTLLHYIQISLNNLEILFRDNFYNKDKIQQLADFYYIKINKIFNENLINKFPFLEKYKNILYQEIAKYSLNIGNNMQKNLSSNNFAKTKSTFKVKSGISSNLFKELHTLVSELELIDDVDINEDDFVSALTESETSSKITFNCSTPLAVHFLSTIKILFNDFTGKSIENSQRFCSKK